MGIYRYEGRKGRKEGRSCFDRKGHTAVERMRSWMRICVLDGDAESAEEVYVCVSKLVLGAKACGRRAWKDSHRP